MAPSSVSFDERITSLLAFEAEHGHLFVPTTFKRMNGLGRFVSNARQKRKLGKLKPDVIAKLDEIGFVWVIPKGSAKDECIQWGKSFRLLVDFHKAKGHCNVPAKIGGAVMPVAAWCDEQRQLLFQGKLDTDKHDKLAKLGFDFYGSEEEEDSRDEPPSKRQRTRDQTVEALQSQNQTLQDKIVALQDEIAALQQELRVLKK